MNFSGLVRIPKATFYSGYMIRSGYNRKLNDSPSKRCVSADPETAARGIGYKTPSDFKYWDKCSGSSNVLFVRRTWVCVECESVS